MQWMLCYVFSNIHSWSPRVWQLYHLGRNSAVKSSLCSHIYVFLAPASNNHSVCQPPQMGFTQLFTLLTLSHSYILAFTWMPNVSDTKRGLQDGSEEMAESLLNQERIYSPIEEWILLIRESNTEYKCNLWGPQKFVWVSKKFSVWVTHWFEMENSQYCG